MLYALLNLWNTRKWQCQTGHPHIFPGLKSAHSAQRQLQYFYLASGQYVLYTCAYWLLAPFIYNYNNQATFIYDNNNQEISLRSRARPPLHTCFRSGRNNQTQISFRQNVKTYHAKIIPVMSPSSKHNPFTIATTAANNGSPSSHHDQAS